MNIRRGLFGVTGVVVVLLLAGTGYAWSRDGTDEPAAATDVEVGRELFFSKGCAACHDIADAGINAGFEAGPDLSNLAETAVLRAGDQSAESYVRASIRSPDAYVVPGYGSGWGMPQLALTSSEVEALVAFLLDGTAR